MSGEMQSAFAVQVVLQAPVPQMYGRAAGRRGAVQTLLLLQVDGRRQRRCRCRCAPAHWVPEGYFWQAPLPLQRPFVPQVDAPWFVHWVVGFGAWPP